MSLSPLTVRNGRKWVLWVYNGEEMIQTPDRYHRPSPLVRLGFSGNY